eukprot:7380630-Prymnesium_polylepis.3
MPDRHATMGPSVQTQPPAGPPPHLAPSIAPPICRPEAWRHPHTCRRWCLRATRPSSSARPRPRPSRPHARSRRRCKRPRPTAACRRQPRSCARDAPRSPTAAGWRALMRTRWRHSSAPCRSAWASTTRA